MDGLSWLALAVGAFLALVVLIDVFLTVLHLDFDGPIARSVFRAVWRTAMLCSRLVPTRQRLLVSLAGPLMIVAVFVIWVGLFILAFALLYWPFLEHFRSDDELVATGFAPALYFSGVTATVLGYGDLTPTTIGLQVLAMFQSALGFALLTGIVTFLISLISGVAQRDALTMNLMQVGGQGENAANAFAQRLNDEILADLCVDLQTLAHDMQLVYQQLRHFPVLDLYYRQSNPAYAPERLIQSAALLAAVGLLAGSAQRYQRLQPLSRRLGQVTTALMGRIAEDHLDRAQCRQLAKAEPGPDDERMARRLAEQLGLPDSPGMIIPDEVLQLICRTRTFMDLVDSITAWCRIADTPEPDSNES